MGENARMRLRHVLEYAASPAEVYDMLADAAFREASCAEQDVVSADVSLTPTGEGFSLVLDQVQRTDDLPSVARRIIGATTRAIQVEEWAEPTGGTLEIRSPGVPAQIAGSISLVDRDGGTDEVVELEVHVKVPLIGRTLESVLCDRIRTSLEGEHRAGIRWLEGDRT